MHFDRRTWLLSAAAGSLAGLGLGSVVSQSPTVMAAEPTGAKPSPLMITRLEVIPVALPDPPILAAGGCHGPYFLRNVVQIHTDAGIVGIGETHGGERVTESLMKARELVVGKNAFAYRTFAGPLSANPSAYAGIELACLDACGKATGRRLCELLGGPVREEVEFAAYLFYRYAADHPKLLADPRIVDNRGRGDLALDQWGEVRSPPAMADLAEKFHRQFGFTVFKLKAGVFEPKEEVAAMRAMNERFAGKRLLRIDPNARWRVETAIRIGAELKTLPLEYYEDPVAGQEDMAKVRRETGLPMSTNMCVTRLEHIPSAVMTKPIDVLLCDHHGFGGITTCQTLGQMCEVLGWKLSQHSNNHGGITMAAMVHVGAVVPQLLLASDTHYPWLPEGADVIQGKNLSFRSGKMAVPLQPGIGVELDQDKLAKAHEVYQKCGMRQRDDAYTMRLVEPNWERTLF